MCWPGSADNADSPDDHDHAVGRDVQMIIFGLIAIGMSIATIDRRTIKFIK